MCVGRDRSFPAIESQGHIGQTQGFSAKLGLGTGAGGSKCPGWQMSNVLCILKFSYRPVAQ